MRTISNVAMVAVTLASVAVVGCGNLGDAETTTTDEAALSTASNNHGVPACGAHDPKRDRDHAVHRRCERYDVKHPHRDAKAGNAHVTTRALTDAQHVTTIEATTGDFDNVAAAPGKIEELHIDVARACPRCRDPKSVFAKALQPRGYASTTMTGLVRGQSLNITAKVSGIDRGTDVVSMSDDVRDRPDLVVGAIDVPASATAGLPASISAMVREAAGDEGANADCVLSVDGAAVDRANGIWVDAAGAVTCHFTTSFATAEIGRAHV